MQYDVGQGPCLETLYEHVTIRSDDMSQESRWPRFASRCVEMGVGSMLAFQLCTDGDDLGALSLFHSQAGGFSDESEQVGLAFAAHAAVAVAAAQQIESPERAVDTRDVTGQAKRIWSATPSTRAWPSRSWSATAATRTSSSSTSPTAWWGPVEAPSGTIVPRLPADGRVTSRHE